MNKISSGSNHCFIIVGYNNTRIYDVCMLRKICQDHFQSELVLVNDIASIHDEDAALFSVIAELDEASISKSVYQVASLIVKENLKPVGILPFSEKGMLLGAGLVEHYNLFGPSLLEAKVGLDKRLFRELDCQKDNFPAGYKPVNAVQVESFHHLKALFFDFGGKLFVKPAKEGNSRGCLAIRAESHCLPAWEKIQTYLKEGLIAEELIDNAKEYSYDSVSGVSWLTEKFTTSGEYSAEFQQIVPAKLSAEQEESLIAAGLRIKEVAAPNYACWHSEIFLCADGSTRAVETNMRPAGMRIWDMANIAFKDFNPWLYWLEWAKTGLQSNLKLERERYCGIRMLRAKKSGLVVEIPKLKDFESVPEGGLIHSAQFYCDLGSEVSDKVTNNADYIGHIMVSHKDYTELRKALDLLANEIEAKIIISLESEVDLTEL